MAGYVYSSMVYPLYTVYPLQYGIVHSVYSSMMYNIPPAVWYGLLCVRAGIYKGAMFKFTVLIPANYPDGGCPVSTS